MQKISELLTESIRYALDHRKEAVAYAREFGRGMDSATTDRFVGMYVNPLTLDMGPKGREAIALMLTRAYHAALVPRRAGEFGVRGIMVCGGKRRARGARRVWRVPYRWLALLLCLLSARPCFSQGWDFTHAGRPQPQLGSDRYGECGVR